MTASRLSLYNGALREMGERKLASLSENREPRRVLDDAWDAGAIDSCLGAGQWRFAKRTVQLVSETDIDPEFGYKLAYRLPDDHIRTMAISADEYFNVPLLQYRQEAGIWYTDDEPIYVSYVSNGASYGGDYALWPAEFVNYVEAYLASKICNRLTQDKTEWDRLFKLARRLLLDAANSDAMEDPTTFPPVGSWVAARIGGRSVRRERGPRGSLLG